VQVELVKRVIAKATDSLSASAFACVIEIHHDAQLRAPVSRLDIPQPHIPEMRTISGFNRKVATVIALLNAREPLLVFFSGNRVRAVQQAHQLGIVGPLERLLQMTTLERT
jgi:hypothetical protein